MQSEQIGKSEGSDFLWLDGRGHTGGVIMIGLSDKGNTGRELI